VAIAEQDSVGGTCVLQSYIPEKLALHNRGMKCIHASIQQRTAKMTTDAANRTTFAVTVVNNLFNSILLKDIKPQLKSNA
jgi:pyruvate/2-oxoglutarate dehydrogenase complex dihydrolipoamide dehydrogenase (E3) component